jgi:hypothetical protein
VISQLFTRNRTDDKLIARISALERKLRKQEVEVRDVRLDTRESVATLRRELETAMWRLREGSPRMCADGADTLFWDAEMQCWDAETPLEHERARKRVEEDARKRVEEDACKRIEDARKRTEDARKRTEDARKRIDDARQVEQDARKVEQDARKLVEENTRKRVEEDAHKRAEEDARKRAEEEPEPLDRRNARRASVCRVSTASA